MTVCWQHPLCRIGNEIAGDHQAILIVNGDQAAIEHPMDRARKSNPISNAVRATIGDGPNVCRLHFRATTAVDNLKTRYRACVLVGRLDGSAERSIAKWSRDKLFNDAAVFVEWAVITKRG